MDDLKYIGRRLSCLSRNSHHVFLDIIGKYNLGKGQIHFLIYLVREEDGLTQEDLSRILEIDKSNTARAIKKLMKEGYVVKKVDDKDKRKNRIYVTEKAIKYEKLIRKEIIAWENAITKGISDEDIEKFLNTLDIMINNILELNKSDT
jgi:DNA-binding MarR family transcriptional regulator